ncbi:hypothetical protein SM11_chr2421 [Sinorhizobium meliloti SM11]|uniref:Uncharacterized protein n=1 Tax=Sinorhizobium meliloti (strain SM11) TaxID=707241 RepID=F7X489_SINMM|nr:MULTISPECIES: hypothetical protein [Sinorhizobium]AEH79675.1 hypothetical protein SM11_chr2421 [Sinorhizobium meliloti SM11]MDE4557465.1 hypothetical protein [Sinorhizobium meliloti SM11]WQO53267.1 hypothetical protein U8C36_06530 [Sinorhizobium medicae]WQO73964.1 hypothetical protein U8C31_06655 [Sinorhizobium medicae]
MITRKGLADEIDQIDEAIKAYNESKREAFDAYRDQLIAAGVAKPNVKIEIEAVKAAIRRRRAIRKDEAAEIEKSELIDEIFDEITTVARAPRAHVENIEKFDREARTKLRTSEAMDDNKAFSAELVAAGLISEEAHAENVALSNVVAMKLGAGVIDAETGEILDDQTEIATASQGETESPSAEAEASGANAGGEDVDRSAERANINAVASASGPDEKRANHSPEEATEMDRDVLRGDEIALAVPAENARKAFPETEDGSVSHAGAGESPATTSIAKPKWPLRPNCRNPEACGGYGDKHCHGCTVAMREKAEEVA